MNQTNHASHPWPSTPRIEGTASPERLAVIASDLCRLLMTTKRHNTHEWMQYLVDRLNHACIELGEKTHVAYDRTRGVITFP